MCTRTAFRIARKPWSPLAVLAGYSFCAAAQVADSAAPAPFTPQSARTVTIPDGTPVHLRFTQPVYGFLVAGADMVREGTHIRLVVGEDVKVADKIVIAWGAPAQSTVIRAWFPRVSFYPTIDVDPVLTGFSLQLDWVTTVTGTRSPLRPLPKGPAQPFDVEVLSGKGGADVKPFGYLRSQFGAGAFHDQAWIPVGARMLGFVDGDVPLDAEELAHAQTDMPPPNLNGTLYLFRTKDKAGSTPAIHCDQRELRGIGARQTAVVDLPPGEHACAVGTSPPVKLTVEGGAEYYLWVKRSGASDWALQPVELLEGEDRAAGNAMRLQHTAEGSAQ